ncbi:hypothetical protein DRN87_04605 [Candidatus Geothermarchaeota archaeon]|nr:MAG: hypothetical protein DRN87_04605 [Candidatus Geothermarchaeota archaeon]HEW93729.1 hypothetical protein [Thermoprotei archaeon]
MRIENMEERWIIRPLHNFLYQLIKNLISKKRVKGMADFITLDEIVHEIRESRLEIDIDEILSNLLKLEAWEYINVTNNGATLEIRLEEGA